MKRLFAVMCAAVLVVAVTANAGTITGGSLTSLNDQDTFVDLTAEGTADWVNWGWTTEKAGGTAIDGTLTLIGTGSLNVAWDSRINVSWTDGDPNPTGNNEKGFNHTGPSVGDGLSFTVAAAEAAQTLKVYVVGWSGEGVFNAALSGGGSYTETFSARQDSGHQFGVFELNFAGAGETLTVTYTMGTGGVGTQWDNVGIQAATLAVPEPATMALLGVGALALIRKRK